MENQTNAPAPVTEEVPQRTHFHLVLGLIFIPFAAVFAGWTIAVWDVLRGYGSRAQLKWTRWLVALVLLDALVAACMGWMLANQDRLQKSAQPPTTPRIGIVFDPAAKPTESRILQVLPESPAERAGLRPGDVVTALDDTVPSSSEDLRKAVAASTPGAPRTLRLRRGETSLEVTVVPELPVEKPRGLFETRPSSSSGDAADWLGGALPYVPAAGVALVAWLVSRKRARSRVVVWRGFLLASLGSVAAAVGAAFLLKAILGGTSLGLLLIVLNVQMIALLGLSIVASRWCGRDVPPPADAEPRLHPVRAALLGLYYLATGFPRATILLFTADQLLLDGATSAGTQALEVLAQAPLGVLGTALFVFVVVFLGPFAEETLFRGFLVPRLAAQWGNGPAMAVSAVIFALFHPQYGLFMPIVLLYGIVFAWARLRTGGIAVPFFLHMTVNGIVSLLMLTRT